MKGTQFAVTGGSEGRGAMRGTQLAVAGGVTEEDR